MGYSPSPEAKGRQRGETAKLILRENGREQVFELRGRSTSLGRAQENDIVLDDINSSRRHCSIEKTGGGYEVVDLKSRNGTLVNGILILRKQLRPGDCIEIGKTRLYFDHVSTDLSPETIDLSTDHFLEPLSGLEEEDQLTVLKKEREIFLKLLEINRTLNSTIFLTDLFDLIIDTVVEVTGAERGFLVLADRIAGSRTAASRLDETAEPPASRDALGAGGPRREPANLAEPRGTTRPPPRAGDFETVASAPRGDSRDGPGPDLRVEAARNMDREPIKEPEVKLCMSIARSVLETGRPLRSDDAMKDRRFLGWIDSRQLELKSVLCVPVRSGERVVGAIYVDNRFKPSAFSENHSRWLEILAHQVAVAIRNAEMFEDLRLRGREVEEGRSRLERINRDLENKVLSKSLQLEEVMKLIPREPPTRFKYEYKAIITRSPKMYEIFSLLDKVTESNVPVLILGESGTGKELIARAIHENGPRQGKAFVSENCAAIPVNLLESEFFGHVRGAFTGATRDKRGLFEVADGGTLFLDEVADMSAAMQTKFLRVLQDGEIRRVGGKDVLKVDVRVISATNKSIHEMVRRNEFREDLLYRINVITINLPPLRERREDIPLLIEHFLESIAQRTGERRKSLSRDTFQLLYQHDWPGNIRELQNEMERLAALGGDVIEPHLLSPNVQAKWQERPAQHAGQSLKDIVSRTVEDVEKHVICSTLRESGWVKTRAAEVLGVSRPTLDAKIEKYGLTREGLGREGGEREDARDRAGSSWEASAARGPGEN